MFVPRASFLGMHAIADFSPALPGMERAVIGERGLHTGEIIGREAGDLFGTFLRAVCVEEGVSV